MAGSIWEYNITIVFSYNGFKGSFFKRCQHGVPKMFRIQIRVSKCHVFSCVFMCFLMGCPGFLICFFPLSATKSPTFLIASSDRLKKSNFPGPFFSRNVEECGSSSSSTISINILFQNDDLNKMCKKTVGKNDTLPKINMEPGNGGFQ